MHFKELPRKCPVCNRTLTKNWYTDNYQCEVCGYVSSENRSLKEWI